MKLRWCYTSVSFGACMLRSSISFYSNVLRLHPVRSCSRLQKMMSIDDLKMSRTEFSKTKNLRRSHSQNRRNVRGEHISGPGSSDGKYLKKITDLCDGGIDSQSLLKVLHSIQIHKKIEPTELTDCYSFAARAYTMKGQFSDVENILIDVCNQIVNPIKSEIYWPNRSDALFVCNQAMGTSSKCGHYETVVRWFHFIDDSPHISTSKFSYSCAMGAAQRAGNNEKVLELMEKLRSEKYIQMDSIMFNCCITAASRLRRWKKALEIFEEMKMTGMKPDVKHYTSAIDAVAKGSEAENAFQIIESLLEAMIKNGISPNVTTFDSAMTACIRAADGDNAVALLRRMKSIGATPDGRIYNNVLKACATAAANLALRAKSDAKVEEMLQSKEPVTPSLLTEMISIGHMPTSYTYASAVTEVGQLKGSQAAVKFLSKAISGGFGDGGLGAVSIHVFNPVLEILAREAQADQAIALMRHAQSFGIMPNSQSYTFCLIGCSQVGPTKWPVVQELLSEVEDAKNHSEDPEQSIRLSSHMYCAAACCLPSWQHAEPFIQRMKANQVIGTIHVYTAILTTIRRSILWGYDCPESEFKNRDNAFKQMMKIVIEMPSFDPPPSPEPWNAVLRVSSMRSDHISAQFLLDQMQLRQVPFDAVTYNSASCAYSRSGCGFKEALDLVDQMRSDGFEPEESTFISLLDACVNNGSKECISIALSVLERESRYLVSSRAHRSIIKVYGMSGYVGGIIDAFEKAKQENFAIKVAAIAITSLDRCGRLDLAEKLIEELGDSCDASTYSAYLEACVRQREAEKAYERLMKIPKSERKIAHYTAMMHAIAAAGDSSTLDGLPMKLYDEIRSQGIEPLPGTYLGALRALKRNGEWEEAFDLLLQMRREGVAMQIGYFNAAIGACTSLSV